MSWGKGLGWVRGLDLLSVLLETIAISLSLACPRTTQQISLYPASTLLVPRNQVL